MKMFLLYLRSAFLAWLMVQSERANRSHDLRQDRQRDKVRT